ncbi:MAG: ABC transporter ATP-binding protein [Candidatus Hodarchaeales archaeon]|jgi:ABC-type branched-subunit amino acid transport system ATPase component
MSDNEIVLEATDIHKHFDGLVALDGTSVAVKKNKLIALIGPNGSGKTTLFNVITGWLSKTNPRNPEEESLAKTDQIYQRGLFDRLLYKLRFKRKESIPSKFITQDVGHVIVDGKRIDGMNAHEIALEGMVRTFQTTRNWANLTVLENLLVAPFRQTGESFLNIFFRRRKIKREERANILKALEILDFLEITQIRDQISKELSGGQLKLLAIGRLLMNSPKLILLDEPLAGVNPTLGNKIMDKIFNLRSDATIFLIEHNMQVVFDFSDEIYVMARGKVIAQGTPNEIENNRDVIEAYLGADY